MSPEHTDSYRELCNTVNHQISLRTYLEPVSVSDCL